MMRRLLNLLALVSLLLCIGVCVLWMRSRSGSDELEWSYDRYLADSSASSNQVHLTSSNRLWLLIFWGHVRPYDGKLGWGYYTRANQSGGRPELSVRHTSSEATSIVPLFGGVDPDAGAKGWGPFRMQAHSRTAAVSGDDAWSLRIGVSHWLVALLLAISPTLRLNRAIRVARRRRRTGLCRQCGYDLRASPQRCPECGRPRDNIIASLRAILPRCVLTRPTLPAICGDP